MSLNKETIRAALKDVKYPGFSRDIVSFGLVQNIELSSENDVTVRLTITTGKQEVAEQLKVAIAERLKSLPGMGQVKADIAVQQPKGMGAAAAASGGQKPGRGNMQGVRYIVTIASGKGGVGKSTFAVNLACALEKVLRAAGNSGGVGIMDCDIYGPSIPLMMGLNHRPEIEGDQIVPLVNYGVKVMSMGLIVDDNAPVVWRGPMVANAIQQFANNVRWAPLEVLVVDLPPGTGDAQLSLVQTLPVDGALIVTTPQAASYKVAQRGAQMFEKVNVPLLGVAENMSYLEDAATGQRTAIFGEGGGKATAEYLETELLGQIALDPRIREGGDRGIPLVISEPNSSAAQSFSSIAQSLWNKLNRN